MALLASLMGSLPTASELQGKPYNVSNDDLIDNRFVSPL